MSETEARRKFLGQTVGFTILRTELHYEGPDAREVLIQIPEDDLNSPDLAGVLEEIEERNRQHAKDAAENPGVDLDDGYPWSAVAFIPVTAADLADITEYVPEGEL